FENRGINILSGVNVTSVEKKNDKKIIYYKYGGQEGSSEVEEVLVAAGKKPVLDLGLEKAKVKTNHSGIVVNKYLQTSNSNIFAAGDVIGPYLFTHSGNYQGFVASHNAFSRKKIRVNYTTVPRCVFITPEVASVGLSEKEAEKKRILQIGKTQ
ncbi:FAD-dependent oxidoreductase, partial [Candidatus Daviesbacteria bacterium]|nr:FAD-dependent oxidoreductase [Candidatus Daviesbacteria bacterium]